MLYRNLLLVVVGGIVGALFGIYAQAWVLAAVTILCAVGVGWFFVLTYVLTPKHDPDMAVYEEFFFGALYFGIATTVVMWLAHFFLAA